MAGTLPWYKTGPMNKQVATLIFGGQLVMPNTLTAGTTDLTVKVATANSVNVLGVAGNDGNAIPVQTGAPNTYGQPQIDISLLTDYISVYYGGIDIYVWYSGQVIEGGMLVAGTTGSVVAFTEQGGGYVQAAGDAAMLVGRCTQPGGVASAQLTQQIGGQGAASFFYGRARIF
jgi:hypothetical protein